MIGIHNTGNQSGGRCTRNNPCEIAEHGTPVAEKGASYGQGLCQIYTCLDADNELDRPGCLPTKPR